MNNKEQEMKFYCFFLHLPCNLYHNSLNLKNAGARFETWSMGVVGPVAVHGLDEGQKDLSWQKWSYKVQERHLSISQYYMHLLGFSLRQDLCVQVGLKGEVMNLVSPHGISSAEWVRGSLAAKKQQPLTWYKVMLSTKAS